MPMPHSPNRRSPAAVPSFERPAHGRARAGATLCRALALGLGASLLSACGHAPKDAARDAEPYPPLLVAGADLGAPILGRIAAAIRFRKGYLADQPDARAYLLKRLRPLDLVLVRSRGKATHHIIPSEFAHVAVYLGSEAELSRAGVWRHPDVQPHARDIRDGAVFIEADVKNVHLSKPERIFDTDRVVVLRPRVRSAAERRTLLAAFYETIGTRFDYHFNAEESETLFCAELANHVLDNQGIPLRRAYGRTTIRPDDMIAEVLAGRSRLTFVAYVVGTPTGWRAGDRGDLAADMEAARTPARRGAQARETCS